MAARHQKGSFAMNILGIAKRGSAMVDHFAQPADSTASAHQDRFAVRESRIGGIVVLSICDEVDMFSAPQFSQAIRDALGNAPAGVIVDLTEVKFLASVGMSALLVAQEEADALSARFGIVAEGAATSRPIRLLGLDDILALYPTLDEALRDFQSNS
jgi:anti-sigma B factor antagonist